METKKELEKRLSRLKQNIKNFEKFTDNVKAIAEFEKEIIIVKQKLCRL